MLKSLHGDPYRLIRPELAGFWMDYWGNRLAKVVSKKNQERPSLDSDIKKWYALDIEALEKTADFRKGDAVVDSSGVRVSMTMKVILAMLFTPGKLPKNWPTDLVFSTLRDVVRGLLDSSKDKSANEKMKARNFLNETVFTSTSFFPMLQQKTGCPGDWEAFKAEVRAKFLEQLPVRERISLESYHALTRARCELCEAESSLKCMKLPKSVADGEARVATAKAELKQALAKRIETALPGQHEAEERPRNLRIEKGLMANLAKATEMQKNRDRITDGLRKKLAISEEQGRVLAQNTEKIAGELTAVKEKLAESQAAPKSRRSPAADEAGGVSPHAKRVRL